MVMERAGLIEILIVRTQARNAGRTDGTVKEQVAVLFRGQIGSRVVVSQQFLYPTDLRAPPILSPIYHGLRNLRILRTYYGVG